MTVPNVLHPFAAPTRRPRATSSRSSAARGAACGTPRDAPTWTAPRRCGTARSATAGARSPTRSPLRCAQVAAYHTFGQLHQRTRAAAGRACWPSSSRSPTPACCSRSRGSEAVDSAMKLTRAGHRADRRRRPHRVPQPPLRLPRRDDRRNLGQRAAGQPPAVRAAARRLLPGRARLARRDAGRGGLPRSRADRGDHHRAGASAPAACSRRRRATCRVCGSCATSRGALLIFDEVITGFGRLGSWFGTQHFGVTPDLMTFAKAITSGYLPLGGVIVGPRARAGGWKPTMATFLRTAGRTRVTQLLRRRDRQPRDPARRGPARAGRRRGAAAARGPRWAGRPARRRRGPRRGPDAGGRARAAAVRRRAGRGAAGARRHRPRPSLRERGRLLAAADHQRRRGRRVGAGDRTRLSPTSPPWSERAGAHAASSTYVGFGERREAVILDVGLGTSRSPAALAEGSTNTASASPTTIRTAPIVNARW